MKIDIVTIFPSMVSAVLGEGILGRAVASGVIDAAVHDLRDFTADRHRVVDDVAYGGGPGMVLKPEPVFQAVEWIVTNRGRPAATILMTPQGRPFNHEEAARLSQLPHVVLICGRYEGIDERVREHVATEELSIGDYVLSGGELAALVVTDAVSRLVPGVVGDEQSVAHDSFVAGLLDCPHYTRPAEWRGHRVPDVLLSGHHAAIARWRRRQAIARTLDRRPELLQTAVLDDEDRQTLRELMEQRGVADGGD